MDDGCYGSFNHIIYDHAVVQPILFREVSDDEPRFPTNVFGPTCDGMDHVCHEKDTNVPRIEVGEWLFWDEMGAYTHCASFVFNGYTNIPKKHYVCTI